MLAFVLNSVITAAAAYSDAKRESLFGHSAEFYITKWSNLVRENALFVVIVVL